MADEIKPGHEIVADELIITVPSGRVVRGVVEPTYGMGLAIDKQTKAEGGDTLGAFLKATCDVWIKQGDVTWDFVDRKNKKPVSVSPGNLLGQSAKDVAFLQWELSRVFYPEMFADIPDGKSLATEVREVLAKRAEAGEEDDLADLLSRVALALDPSSAPIEQTSAEGEEAPSG